MSKEFDSNSPFLVANGAGFIVGIATKWNSFGLGEVIVQYFDGSASSELASELRFPNGRQKAYDALNDRERATVG